MNSSPTPFSSLSPPPNNTPQPPFPPPQYSSPSFFSLFFRNKPQHEILSLLSSSSLPNYSPAPITEDPLDFDDVFTIQKMEDQQIPLDPRTFRKRKRVCVRSTSTTPTPTPPPPPPTTTSRLEKDGQVKEEEMSENGRDEMEVEGDESKKGKEKEEEEEEEEEEREGLRMKTRSSKKKRENEENGKEEEETNREQQQEGAEHEEEGNEMRAQEQEFHERMFCLLSFLSSSSFGHGKDNAWRRKYILLKRHLLQAFSTCLDDQIDAIIHERVEEKMEREIEEGDGDFDDGGLFNENQRSLRSASRRSRHLNQDYRWEEPLIAEPPKKKPKVSIILRCGTCAGDLDSDYLCMVCPNAHQERIRCQICYKFLGPYRTQNSRQNGVAQHGRLCKGVPAQGMSLDLPPPKSKPTPPESQKTSSQKPPSQKPPSQKPTPAKQEKKEKSWTAEDLDSLLIILQETLPCTTQEWVESTSLFNKNYASVRGRPQRTPQSVQDKFESLDKHGQHQHVAKRVKRLIGVKKKSKKEKEKKK